MPGAGDQIGDLASAYLGGRQPTPQPSGDPDRVHLVIVGNVPALAGIWLAQLADQCGRESGPVALLRLDPHAPRAELFRAEGRALPAEPSAWMQRAGAVASRWLVCALGDAAARSMIAAEAPLMLVTGTDEAALAAARRIIASICAEAESLGVDAPDMELAVVGSAPEVARSAADALSRWTASDPAVSASGMSVTLALVAPRVERIAPSTAVMLPAFAALTPREAIERVRDAVRSGASRFLDDDAPLVIARDEGTPRLAEPQPWARAPGAPANAAPAQPAPAGSFSVAPAAAPWPAAAAPARGQVDPAAAPRANGHDLCALFPEWVPLRVECPDAREVAFATSGDAVHAISADASLRGLRVAAAWLRMQWSLISALAPGLDRSAPKVIEHLVLDDARHAVPLHRCGILLHARLPVTVGATTTHQRIDLNDPSTAGPA